MFFLTNEFSFVSKKGCLGGVFLKSAMPLISQTHLLIDHFFYPKTLIHFPVSSYPEGILFSRLLMNSSVQMTVKLYFQWDSLCFLPTSKGSSWIFLYHHKFSRFLTVSPSFPISDKQHHETVEFELSLIHFFLLLPVNKSLRPVNIPKKHFCRSPSFISATVHQSRLLCCGP